MTTLNISLPEDMKTWINQRIVSGDYSNASEYIQNLISRDYLQQRLAEPPPDEFANMSEAEVIQMVREEIQAYRKGKT
ncbi:MAG: type II toxin-antitoxin system ParD family antitoxin [Candidatus Thiothrix sulfatifontis]|nr:MAG: type II toxin-antitoxin system ParD family antitoxin [Candidatus Thiothrix sulfatifontis]